MQGMSFNTLITDHLFNTPNEEQNQYLSFLNLICLLFQLPDKNHL